MAYGLTHHPRLEQPRRVQHERHAQRRLVREQPVRLLSVIAERLPIGLPAPPGVPPVFVVTGVAVDAAGVVYVSSDLEDAIYRLVPE